MFSKLKTKLSKDSARTSTKKLDCATIDSVTTDDSTIHSATTEASGATSKLNKPKPTKTYVYAAHAFALKS